MPLSYDRMYELQHIEKLREQRRKAKADHEFNRRHRRDLAEARKLLAGYLQMHDEEREPQARLMLDVKIEDLKREINRHIEALTTKDRYIRTAEVLPEKELTQNLNDLRLKELAASMTQDDRDQILRDIEEAMNNPALDKYD